MKRAGEPLFVVGSVVIVFLIALVFLLNFESREPVNAFVTQAACIQGFQALEKEMSQLNLLEKQIFDQKKKLEEFEKQNAQYIK